MFFKQSGNSTDNKQLSLAYLRVHTVEDTGIYRHIPHTYDFLEFRLFIYRLDCSEFSDNGANILRHIFATYDELVGKRVDDSFLCRFLCQTSKNNTHSCISLSETVKRGCRSLCQQGFSVDTVNYKSCSTSFFAPILYSGGCSGVTIISLSGEAGYGSPFVCC